MATDNWLLIWTKSISLLAEEDAVGDCRAGAEGESRSSLEQNEVPGSSYMPDFLAVLVL